MTKELVVVVILVTAILCFIVLILGPVIIEAIWRDYVERQAKARRDRGQE